MTGISIGVPSSTTTGSGPVDQGAQTANRYVYLCVVSFCHIIDISPHL